MSDGYFAADYLGRDPQKVEAQFLRAASHRLLAQERLRISESKLRQARKEVEEAGKISRAAGWSEHFAWDQVMEVSFPELLAAQEACHLASSRVRDIHASAQSHRATILTALLIPE